jgi:hypothetical protein
MGNAILVLPMHLKEAVYTLLVVQGTKLSTSSLPGLSQNHHSTDGVETREVKDMHP